MAIKVVHHTAPAHWASYFINGDATGFDYSNTSSDPDAGDRELAAADAFLAEIAPARVMDVDGESFFGQWRGMGTDLCRYVCRVEESADETNERLWSEAEDELAGLGLYSTGERKVRLVNERLYRLSTKGE